MTPRVSGPSQEVRDYVHEAQLKGLDWNAIDDIRNSATDSARVAAAWYLMSDPKATDCELHSDYVSQYNAERNVKSGSR